MCLGVNFLSTSAGDSNFQLDSEELTVGETATYGCYLPADESSSFVQRNIHEIEWLKNNARLTSSNLPHTLRLLKFPSADLPSVVQLRFVQAQKSDAGNYTCLIEYSQYDSDNHVKILHFRRTTTVTVVPPQQRDAPAITSMTPQPANFIVGSEARLVCNTQHARLIFWTRQEHHEVLQTTSKRYSNIFNGTLVIYSVDLSDAGAYTCHAGNSQAVVRHSMFVNVLQRSSGNGS